MTSRVNIIRKAYGLSLEQFAERLDIHFEYAFMAENAFDPNDIPEFITERIETKFHLSRKFVIGCPYTLRKPVSDWSPDQRQDYNAAGKDLKEVLTAQFGYCEYSDSSYT